MINEKNIREKIRELHSGDERQLEVIFSKDKRVIVEAPAGYGKTTTMVSRLAYLYSIHAIPNPKKILGLTFSVNAALKVKRDIASKLPELIAKGNNPNTIKNVVVVTNYHGFCKSVLKKYGYLISPFLKKDLNIFTAVGEYDIKKVQKINYLIDSDEYSLLCNVADEIKLGTMPSTEKINQCIEILKQKFLPKDVVTHTGIILMTLQLLDKNREVAEFYKNYYSVLVVDEFQDTNVISWTLLKQIIGPKTQLLFLGDSLQRIYGFIGALPNVMELAQKEYSMREIQLEKNYRFMHNVDMLNLDHNIRLNAKANFKPVIETIANIPAFWGKTHEDESFKIVEKIKDIKKQRTENKIAILSRGRGYDVGLLEEQLKKDGVGYFYGMFTDDDDEYVRFHIMCQELFVQQFKQQKSITNRNLKKFIKEVRKVYETSNSKIIISLLELLNAFAYKITNDYSDLLPEDKYNFILDTFENRQLKQSMEYVEADVILSTIHGAKGLEWDYVFIMDVERWIFPGRQICKNCDSKFNKECICEKPINLTPSMLNNMLEELSVFYVAVTRARKQVYLSASATRYNYNKEKKQSVFSCFAKLKGVKLVDASKMTYGNLHRDIVV